MKLKTALLTLLAFYFILGCQKEETITTEQETNETQLSEIADFDYNNEALRYFSNMGDFIDLTTSDITPEKAIQLKSASSNVEDSTVNPILEEFLNLDIEDENGNMVSFFELDADERADLIQLWIMTNAYDLTPKLNDPYFEGTLEEYIKEQNDAFDEAMQEYIDQYGCDTLKSALVTYSSNEIYKKISAKVTERIKKVSEEKSEEYLALHPEISSPLKSTDFPDYVDPEDVLDQMQEYAERGNILINPPAQIWLSQYLFFFAPTMISKYIGTGKYPPGHTSIVIMSGDDIKKTSNNISISSQNYDESNGYSINGVQYEQINGEWNCKARLCYVKKRVFKKWKWRTVYPDAEVVIDYAESQLDKPYCWGDGKFITAKPRTECFICTTITWRSFKQDDFNIHCLEARWMPTIAPVDIYSSSHVVRKHTIQ